MAILGSAWIARWQFRQYKRQQDDAAKLADLNAALKLVAMLGRTRDSIDTHWYRFIKPTLGFEDGYLDYSRAVTDRERVPTPVPSELDFLLRIRSGGTLYQEIGDLVADIGQWLEITARRGRFFEQELDASVKHIAREDGQHLTRADVASAIRPFSRDMARSLHAGAVEAIGIARAKLMEMRPRILDAFESAFPGESFRGLWPERGELTETWHDPGGHGTFRLLMKYGVAGNQVDWELQVSDANSARTWTGSETLPLGAGNVAGRTLAQAQIENVKATKLPDWSAFVAKGRKAEVNEKT